MVDCIIVGSGIAGISAALTLRSNGKSFLIFGTNSLSEKIEKAEKIANYPGLSLTTGKDFVSALQTQLRDLEISITEEKVTGVYALKGKFSVLTDKGNTYDGLSVIVCSGVESIRTIEGEEEFFGRGVSYCATCDGFLYKGKTIAVFCTSKRLEHEIEYLSDFAEKVYLIPMYKKAEIERSNIEKIIKMPKKITGGMKANTLVFDDRELSIDGIFMLRESVLPSALVGGLQTENGHVAVDRNMQTNLKGCFAAGDCTGRPYQYAKAAGEGNIAAHSVCEYLAQLTK